MHQWQEDQQVLAKYDDSMGNRSEMGFCALQLNKNLLVIYYTFPSYPGILGRFGVLLLVNRSNQLTNLSVYGSPWNIWVVGLACYTHLGTLLILGSTQGVQALHHEWDSVRVRWFIPDRTDYSALSSRCFWLHCPWNWPWSGYFGRPISHLKWKIN